jgi:peptidoglycan/LPS O-acetylase OafA/YrhL
MEVVAPQQRGNIAGLTSVRFFAALAVVFYHTLSHWNLPGLDEVWRFSRLGSDGVNLFFVLSGFILFYVYEQSLDNGSFKTRTFLCARLARIYPVYLVGLIVALPGFLVRLFDTGPAHANAMTTLAVPLLVQAWVPDTACGWNCPGWSLSAEVFFYLLFPTIGIFLVRQNRRTIPIFLLAAYALTVAIPVAYLLAGRPTAYSEANSELMVLRFNPLLRLPEFVFGMLVARLTMSGATPFQRSFPRWLVWLVVAGVVVILYASYYLPIRITDTMVQNGLYVPLFALMIVAIAKSETPVFHHKWLVRLGEASYALYIVHMPIWGMFQFSARKGLIADPSGQMPIYLCFLGLTLGSALLINRYIENPYRDAIQAWFRQRRERSLDDVPTGFIAYFRSLRRPAHDRAAVSSRMYVGVGFDGPARRS